MRVERRGGAPSAASAPAPPPPFITNTAIAGDRDVVFLLDEEGIPAGREAIVRTAFGHLLAALGPTDRISVLTSKGRAVWSAPTTDRRRVTDALGAIAGRATRGETTADAICRSRIDLFALVDALKSVDPSVSTVIVFVTNGFTPPTVIEEIARGQGPEGPCELMPRDLSTLTAAADASHAHLFVAQVVDDGLTGDATASEMTRMVAVSASSGGLRGSPVATAADLSAGLEHVAGLTGNGIIRLMGDSAASMQRIARETSAYYLAAFEVPASERTGATQRVESQREPPGCDRPGAPHARRPEGGRRGREAGQERSADAARHAVGLEDLSRAAVAGDRLHVARRDRREVEGGRSVRNRGSHPQAIRCRSRPVRRPEQGAGAVDGPGQRPDPDADRRGTRGPRPRRLPAARGRDRRFRSGRDR